MSIDGIRSNRGDGYQTLVAFDWALTVLADPKYLWLEIDSIQYSVDDVVLRKADGTLIACQCKKNQTDFKSWSICDLADELEKAFRLLESDQSAEVRFYSRNNFGAVAKLREHCATQDDAGIYEASLTKELLATHDALTDQLSKSFPNLSCHDFLCRSKFVTTDELERMIELLHERLRALTSNPEAAFDALWRTLDQLGARIGGDGRRTSQQRLTGEDLKKVLCKAGAMLAPQANIAEVRSTFAETSAIGRSWLRDIGGQRIANPVVNDLLSAIHAKQKAILLTGQPGSGKTCAMLELQEALEQEAQAFSEVAPIFIQSREYADLIRAQDRQDKGLPEQWVEKVARLTEHAHVTIVMDSLDVLSTARDHRVLDYFLAQIDRLMMLPNISVVTACRDFDRHYDRRIALRKWDQEFQCQPLDWETGVLPVLDRQGITPTTIDEATRDLIKNPRELALFVSLAKREGCFNVVTSQALAQRYLDTIVRANGALGDLAMRAIEGIAADMLKSRSLTVPHQLFNASDDILRTLCSLNVLKETHDGKITFGHQTLLDVLVISGALRNRLSLTEFIKGLQPVPFVRPSIRSFVAQLAAGERREFRKQLRSVLTSEFSFHIRRLVAESYAEQGPADDDWPLLRELRERHRDVFQVIYGAGATEWHHFWLRHLVPELKTARDTEGLTRHVYRVAQWAGDDTAGVLGLWADALALEWLDHKAISERIGLHLPRPNTETLPLTVSLAKRLLELPRHKHSSLGRLIAHCVSEGAAEDCLLWRYISDGVSEESILTGRLDDALWCDLHEFGDHNEGFLHRRIQQSSALLDLALEAVERWSDIRRSHYGDTRNGYRFGFLGETSYEDAHSQREMRHAGSTRVLLGGIEVAIIGHAKRESEWWRDNRARLANSREGAIIYFTILACRASPEANADLIGGMLCNKSLLEFDLSYELGELINTAFPLLDSPAQDAAMANILALWSETGSNEPESYWVLRRRSELIVAIPCHLRSLETQAVLSAYEAKAGTLVREPEIRSIGGLVRAPFSYETLLNFKTDSVLRLLSHYAGYRRWFDDSLVGGEREVGAQLREASSRQPIRFLGVLRSFWPNVPDGFRDDILDGVSSHLAYRYGNLQANDTWKPIEDPDGRVLYGLILDELERHLSHWHRRRSAARALEACSHVVFDTRDAARLTFLAIGFQSLDEDESVRGDNVDLITIGINMAKGNIADGLMVLASNLQESGSEFPELLVPALRCFASDKHPAVRSLILRRLCYFQTKAFSLGWELFELAMRDSRRLWGIAEPCLYYAYRRNFEVVSPLLPRTLNEGTGTDLQTWARISALSVMSRKIELSVFLDHLKSLCDSQAWKGAATVWSHPDNFLQHREQCAVGLHAGLDAGGSHAEAIAQEMEGLFNEEAAFVRVPLALIERLFDALKGEKESHQRLYRFPEWLSATALLDPELALSAIEIYLEYVARCKPYIYDSKGSFAQLMTRLFSEAEEREESDRGAMLRRVVATQDHLLSLDVKGVADWLKAAERP